MSEYEEVQYHIDLNATIVQTCQLLEERLSKTLDMYIHHQLISDLQFVELD